jgi:hypothetical protein
MTRTMRTTSIETAPEPAPGEIDGMLRELEGSWKAVITVRRQAPNDVGYREVFVSIDDERPEVLLMHGEVLTREVSPGPHRLKAHNTLFIKTIDFTIDPGEHAQFITINRAGFGTYSGFAFLFGFLGAGPFYLTLERERAA